MSERHDVVQSALAEIRSRRDLLGPSHELIEAVKPVLSALAANDDLFPQATFAVDEGSVMTIYELSADLDGRLGLYASAGLPGKYQPPHDHRTWSCIAGVRGAEHNQYFARTDDGQVDGQGALEPRGELTLRHGMANGMLGDAFHAIRVLDEGEALHLHLYGHTLDRLAGRIYFEAEAGGAWKPFMLRPDLHTARLSPTELAAMVESGAELAVLDTRGQQAYATAHVADASPVPFGSLELAAPHLLVRRDVPVVVVADTAVLGHRGGQVLRRGGFANTAVLTGGVDDWDAAGLAIHDGMNTTQKAFGEYVAKHCETPAIAARELMGKIEHDQPFVLLDCRPPSEYEAMHVPGALNAPGVELLSRAHDIELGPDTPVVVTCAGRTRSIIGSQTLVDAGLANPVFALEGGAMGWHLAGGELSEGDAPVALTDPRPASTAAAREAAAVLAASAGVPSIDEPTLAAWQHDPSRSTYLFDVRSRERYEAGHREEFDWAVGGQLIQELSAKVAIRGARIVLVDDDGVQARVTAYWLRRMGWEASVLPDATVGAHLVSGPDARRALPPENEPPVVTVADVAGAVAGAADDDLWVIDCGSSSAYGAGHIPTSRHCLRADLPPALEGRGGRRVVLTSEDGAVARYAASDAIGLGCDAATLVGGTAAWVSAGHSLVAEDPVFLGGLGDVWLKPYQRTGDPAEAMRAYLDWEIDLLDRVDTSQFRLEP